MLEDKIYPGNSTLLFILLTVMITSNWCKTEIGAGGIVGNGYLN